MSTPQKAELAKALANKILGDSLWVSGGGMYADSCYLDRERSRELIVELTLAVVESSEKEELAKKIEEVLLKSLPFADELCRKATEAAQRIIQQSFI